MARGQYPAKTAFNFRQRLKRLKSFASNGSNLVTISQNTGATYTGFTASLLREVDHTSNFYPLGFNGTGIEAGNNGAGDRSHSILNINGISSIPANSTITSVTMRLFLTQVSGATYDIAIRKMLVASDVTQCTWDSRLTGTAWNTAGCLGNGTDRASTVLASATVTNNQQGNLDFTGPNLTQAVQDIVNGVTAITWFEIEALLDTVSNGFSQIVADQQLDGQRPILFVTYTLPNGLYLPITGIQSTASQGTVSPAIAPALVGIQSTAAQGTISPAIAPALAGIQSTASQGTVSPAIAPALAGIQAVSSRGTITTAIAPALTSVLATTSQGTVTYSTSSTAMNISITGIQATSSQGNIPEVLSLSLAGIQSAASQGTVSPAIAPALVGIQSSILQGAVSPAITQTLAGIQATASQGAVTTAIAPTLASVLATTTQGTVTYSTAATTLNIPITGVQAATSQGAVTTAIAPTLASVLATTTQGIITFATQVTTLELGVAGIQAVTGQGAVVYATTTAIVHRSRRASLQPIIDTKASAASGRVALRSGKATVFEPLAVAAYAHVLPIQRIRAKSSAVIIQTTRITRATAKSGVPADIYARKISSVIANSSVHTTSRLVTVITGRATAMIIAAAYPSGTLIPIRAGEVSYIHTTRYS